MFVVTGGAGFIGSNIVAELEERGLGPVAVCDRLGSDEKWRNLAKRELAHLVAPEGLFDLLAEHRRALTAVIHMGAVSSTLETDADLAVEANFRLSCRLFQWCAANGVRLIYASSAATYGDGSAGFADDDRPDALARLKPLNLYGWSKHLFDRWVAKRAADGGVLPPQWAGLKFFNVFGPNEYHKGMQKSVVATIYPDAASGRACRLFQSHRPDYPDGGQKRDFVWVEDCVAVVLWLLDHPGANGIFNCGTGQARSFADLAGAVYQALGKEPRIEYVPTPQPIRDRYQYFTEARMDRLAAAGFPLETMTSLEDAVTQYVQGYLSAPEPYR